MTSRSSRAGRWLTSTDIQDVTAPIKIIGPQELWLHGTLCIPLNLGQKQVEAEEQADSWDQKERCHNLSASSICLGCHPQLLSLSFAGIISMAKIKRLKTWGLAKMRLSRGPPPWCKTVKACSMPWDSAGRWPLGDGEGRPQRSLVSLIVLPLVRYLASQYLSRSWGWTTLDPTRRSGFLLQGGRSWRASQGQ